MATKDKAKREANEAAARARATVVRDTRSASEIARSVSLRWSAFGWPEEERPAATAWAGGLERLDRYLSDLLAEIDRIRTLLDVRPLPLDVKERIRLERIAFENGDADALTALGLARELNLPLEVVRYVADGEPRIDTQRRPWLPRPNFRRNSK